MRPDLASTSRRAKVAQILKRQRGRYALATQRIGCGQRAATILQAA
jgi:hypothetical protein